MFTTRIRVHYGTSPSDKRSLFGHYRCRIPCKSGKVGSLTVDSYDKLLIAEGLAKRFSRHGVSACEKSNILTANEEYSVYTMTEWDDVRS
jgi:hypothetical protein